jgi:hypothetical protein
MQAYRLYILDTASHIRESELIEAESDSEAIRRAKLVLEGRPGELWLSNKNVCTFGRGMGKGSAP